VMAMLLVGVLASCASLPPGNTALLLNTKNLPNGGW
jgi:hypothetical protein